MSKVLNAQTKEQKKAIEFLLKQSKVKFTTVYNRKDSIYSVNIAEQAKSTRSADYISYLLKDIKESCVVRKVEGKKVKKAVKAIKTKKTIKKKYNNTPISKADLTSVKIAKDTYRIEHKGNLLEVVSEACLETAMKQWEKRTV